MHALSFNASKLAIFTLSNKCSLRTGMKFLVIQQKMIGDVLTSTVICENLKHLHPNCKVHFIANENTLAVLRNNPFIDEIIVFKNEYRKSKKAFYGFLKGMKKERYHAVIDAYGKLESNLISYFTPAQYKIAHPKWYTKWIYTDTVTENLSPSGIIPLAIGNRLQLLNPLLKMGNPYHTYPKIYLSDSEVEASAKKIAPIKSYPDQPVIMIGILGSGPVKTYPADHMAKVLNTICEHTPAILLFNYIPSQENEARTIYDQCNEKTRERIAFDFYASSLRDFIALLSHCSALIGNEGGAVNMAKALDVPTFCMFSPFIIKGAWHSETAKGHTAVHLKDYRPEVFENRTKRDIKKNIQQLYDTFEPQLFEEPLIRFVKEYCT